MLTEIAFFDGEFAFLSNFYYCPVQIGEYIFKASEVAFQASKTTDHNERMKFVNMNPSQSKRAGRRVKLRPDWEEVKDAAMYIVVKSKFLQNERLCDKLMSTGDRVLIEGNTWKDQYWGMYEGKGRNQLGKILMQVREEFRNKDFSIHDYNGVSVIDIWG